MKVDASSAVRGGHANSCDELIVALSGSVLVECDNGEEHFAGTAQAILHCGARPRFVDVDPATRCIDPAAVAAAILPVHLFGHPCDMPALMALAGRHGLAMVEDCAQSHGGTLGGKPLGSFGHAAAYSFYPTRNENWSWNLKRRCCATTGRHRSRLWPNYAIPPRGA